MESTQNLKSESKSKSLYCIQVEVRDQVPEMSTEVWPQVLQHCFLF